MVQKELRKLSQWFWKGFLKWYDGGGENGITSKWIFEVEMFFPFKILTSPLFEETLGAFLSLPLFFSFFVSWGVLMIFEQKITSSKTYFQMASIYWWWTHILEWSYARQQG
jgi:hypothetical protein